MQNFFSRHLLLPFVLQGWEEIWVWLIRNRVLRVQLMFVRFKSSGNQTGFNRQTPGNRFGRLTWARDRSSISDRSIPMRSCFADWVNWTSSISICYAFLCVFCILIRINWFGSTGSDRLGANGSISPTGLSTFDV